MYWLATFFTAAVASAVLAFGYATGTAALAFKLSFLIFSGLAFVMLSAKPSKTPDGDPTI